MATRKGFIIIDRAILDHWIWTSEPFSKGQAWIDLLLLANHRPKKMLLDGGLETIPRGSRVTSIQRLGERWKWSRSKVNRFLEKLQKDEMISYKKRTGKFTAITIENYSKWQDVQDQDEQQTNSWRTGGEQVANINNNNNNINNITSKDILSGKPDPASSDDVEKVMGQKVSSDTGIPGQKASDDTIPYERIIRYLNARTQSSFKAGSKATRSRIRARFREGFKAEDFKKVIDVKCAEWLHDDKMAKYLRPETLFGAKFEGYLNQAPAQEVGGISGKTTAAPRRKGSNPHMQASRNIKYAHENSGRYDDPGEEMAKMLQRARQAGLALVKEMEERNE